MKQLILSNTEAARRKRRKQIRREFAATALVLPVVLGFAVFGIFPMIVSLIVSLMDLRSYNISLATWTGLDNYIAIFKEIADGGWVLTSLKNTLIYCLRVPINLAVAVALANVISKKLRGNKIMRVILFLPQVVSGVAITLIWKWMFEENFGVVNTTLGAIGIDKIPWLTEPNWFYVAVFIISLWQTGTNVLILESAFLNVDKNLQEAARIDGATEMQVFWKITFPALTPSIFYLLTMWLIAALQEQTVMQIIAANGTGPSDSALTVTYYIYMMAFMYPASKGFGIACALSWVYALVIMAVTKMNFWLSKYWVKYD